MKQNDNLIVIKRSRVKKAVGKFVKASYKNYLKFMKATTTFWLKLFAKENKRYTQLLDNEYIVFALNIILLAGISLLFGGIINQLLLYFAIINIFIVCFKILGVLDKIISWADLL